jgi:L-2-hydroxyglutarate oxidase
MIEFAIEHGIPHKVTGKLIVATSEADEGRLTLIADRAQQNQVDSELIGRSQILELEPHCGSHLALHVKKTAIINFGEVAGRLADLTQDQGAELILGSKVTAIFEDSRGVLVEHEKGTAKADFLINGAGLHSDKVANLAGLKTTARIFPFRGEYFELNKESSGLVNGLIYPTPDPDMPFLGVHLTKMVSGGVHAGPNAVLALAREGYSWSALNLRDIWETVSYPGFAKLAAENIPTGLREIIRSLSPSLFARDLSKLVPGIEAKHLVKSESGVRAQAIDRNGKLVDDFVIHRTKNQVHILNAPSPAATASIAIARHLVRSLGETD